MEGMTRSEKAAGDDSPNGGDEEKLERCSTTASQQLVREELLAGNFEEDEPEWLKNRKALIMKVFDHVEKCLTSSKPVVAAERRNRQTIGLSYSQKVDAYVSQPPPGTDRWAIQGDLKCLGNWRNQIQHKNDTRHTKTHGDLFIDGKTTEGGVPTPNVLSLVKRLRVIFPAPKALTPQKKRQRTHSPERGPPSFSFSSSSSSSSASSSSASSSPSTPVRPSKVEDPYSPGGYMSKEDEEAYANFDIEGEEARHAAKLAAKEDYQYGLTEAQKKAMEEFDMDTAVSVVEARDITVDT